MTKLEIQTPLGTLYAVPSADQENYPGIVIGIQRDGYTADFVLVEVGNTGYKEDDGVNVHVWKLDKHVWDFGPCFDMVSSVEEVEEAIKEWES